MKKVLLGIFVVALALVFAPQESQAGDFRISFSSGGYYGGHYRGGHCYTPPPRYYCPPPRYYAPPRRSYYRRHVPVYRVAPPVHYERGYGYGHRSPRYYYR